MQAIRGAISVNLNTKKEILVQSKKLIQAIIDKNNLTEKQIVSIIFSVTKDLTMAYPAAAARNMGLVHTPLFCLQEMHVKGSMKKCIRVLMHVEDCQQITHCYLEKAQTLRSDL